MLTFTIPGQPQGKGRPRVGKTFGGHARMFTPEQTVNYEGMIRVVAHQAMAGRPLIEAPVRVFISMGCQVPGSWSDRKQARALAGEVFPTTKPDMDNTLKAVFDALNGVVWKDDVQVCDLGVVKRYSASPGVTVSVRLMAEVVQPQAKLVEAA